MTDHGMTESEGKISTKVTNFLDPDAIEMACEVGAYMQIGLTDADLVDEAVSNLTAWGGVNVYRKEDVPEYLSYQDSEYIMDVVLVSQGEQIMNSDFLYSTKFVPQPTPSVEGILRP